MNKNKFLFLVINIIISILLSICFSNFAIAVINVVLLLILILIVGKSDGKIYRHILIVYIMSVFAMLALYIGYINKYDDPYYLGGSDDKNFELWAMESIEDNNYTIKDIMETKKFKYYNCNGFIWIMSLIIRFSNIFSGYHTIIIRLINVYMMIFTGILSYKYFSNNEQKISEKIKLFYIICLFPNALYTTIHGFRDAIFIFIIFSIFYLLNYYKSRNIIQKILTVLYVILMSYIIYYIRKVGILYIGIIIILNIMFKESKITEKKELFKVLILIAFAGIYCVKSGIINETGKYLDRYNEYILSNSFGLSSLIFSTPLFPFGIILRIVYGLIFPAPTGLIITNFDVDSICQFIVSVGTIYQIYMLPYIAKNIQRIDKVFLIFIIIFLSIIVTTFNFRHFLTLYPFMFILVNRVRNECSKKEKNQYMFIMTLILILGLTLYLFKSLI